MAKRIIFTENDSDLGAEIEMFLNAKGNVSIVIKYKDDEDADCRVIQLHPDDFYAMVGIVKDEIQENIED